MPGTLDAISRRMNLDELQVALEQCDLDCMGLLKAANVPLFTAVHPK